MHPAPAESSVQRPAGYAVVMQQEDFPAFLKALKSDNPANSSRHRRTQHPPELQAHSVVEPAFRTAETSCRVQS